MVNGTFKDFTLLYIEDDTGVRNIMLSILRRMFKETYEAEDGEVGYQLYLEKSPDIIVTDIRMPKLDGIALSKKIREKDKETKIIITTAFSDEKYLIDAVELNLERYLVKPLTKRNLIPALEKAVSSIAFEKKLFITNTFFYNYHTALFYWNGENIEMTQKELAFLTLLAKHHARVVTYTEIEYHIWNNEHMSFNSLRTMVGFLRKKIPPHVITNISNMGYRLTIDHN